MSADQEGSGAALAASDGTLGNSGAVARRGGGGTAVPGSGTGRAPTAQELSVVETAFRGGNVHNVLDALCEEGETPQILAHVSSTIIRKQGPGLGTDSAVLAAHKFYVVRVVPTDGEGCSRYLHVRFEYELQASLSGSITYPVVRCVRLGSRALDRGADIIAPSGSLEFDKVWKASGTGSGSAGAQGSMRAVPVHSAIFAIPGSPFDCQRSDIITFAAPIDINPHVHRSLLTDACVYQDTTMLHRDAMVTVTSGEPDAVRHAVVDAMYYADHPGINIELTPPVEYSIGHPAVVALSSRRGPRHGATFERHYVFKTHRGSRVHRVHAFIALDAAKHSGSSTGQGQYTTPAFAVRVCSNTFRLSHFLAASVSANVSAEQQQFVVHSPQDTRTTDTDAGSSCSSEGTTVRTTAIPGGSGAAAQQVGGLPLLVVNSFESDLKATSKCKLDDATIKYLLDVTRNHAVGADMNRALVESLTRIIPTGGKRDFECADEGLRELLSSGNVSKDGQVIKAPPSTEGSSALDEFRNALGLQPGTTDLLLRAIINTCDTVHNGFTVVQEDKELHRIQPTVKQSLALVFDDAASVKKAKIIRKLELEYKISEDDAFKTSVDVSYELSLATLEDGRMKLTTSNILATATDVDSTRPGTVVPTPTVLSYPSQLDTTVSDLSQLFVESNTPLAICAAVGSYGLRGVFLPQTKETPSGAATSFAPTRGKASASIVEFYKTQEGEGGSQFLEEQLSDTLPRLLGLLPCRLRHSTGSCGTSVEISEVLRSVSGHLIGHVTGLVEEAYETSRIPGRGADNGCGVIAGTRVKRLYKMSTPQRSLYVCVEHDLLLVESTHTDREGQDVVYSDHIVCNMKIGCSGDKENIEMLAFPDVTATVRSDQRREHRMTATVASSTSGVSHTGGDASAAAHHSTTEGGSGEVVPPSNKEKDGGDETAATASEHKKADSGGKVTPSIHEENVSEQPHTDAGKDSSATSPGGDDVPSGVPSDNDADRTEHAAAVVCDVTDAKITVSKLNDKGAAEKSATFTIPSTKSSSASAPYDDAKAECKKSGQRRHRDGVSAHKTRRDRVRTEGKPKDRKGDKEAAFVAEKKAPATPKEEQQHSKTWFAQLWDVVWHWLVLVVMLLLTYIVAMVLWSRTYLLCGLCSLLRLCRRSPKVEEGETLTSVVGLRGFATRQNVVTQPIVTHPDEHDGDRSHSHASNTDGCSAGGLAEYENAGSSEDASSMTAQSQRVSSRSPGSALHDSAVASAVASGYSSASTSEHSASVRSEIPSRA